MNGAAAPPAPPAPPPVPDAIPSDGELMAEAMKQLSGSGSDTEAPTKPEGAPPPEPAEPEKPKGDEPPAGLTPEELSRSWARLNAQKKRDSKRFEADKAAAASEKQAAEAIRKEAEALKADFEARAARAKKSPLEALQQLGWTLPQITKYVAENGEIPQEKIFEGLKAEYTGEIEKLRAELKQLNDGIASRQKQEEEARSAAERQRSAEQYEQRTKAEAQELVKASPTKYPSLAKAIARGALEEVHRRAIDYQLAHFSAHADAIEAGEEKPLAFSDALLYAEQNLARIFSWFGEVPAQGGTAIQAGKPGAEKPETAPISNVDLGSRVPSPKDEDDIGTDEERFEKARKILSGE